MVGRAIDMAREAFQQNPEEFAKFGAIRYRREQKTYNFFHQ